MATAAATGSRTRWGGLIMILSQPLRLMLSKTPAWLAFAGWLTAALAR
jgi:hypothetical protein